MKWSRISKRINAAYHMSMQIAWYPCAWRPGPSLMDAKTGIEVSIDCPENGMHDDCYKKTCPGTGGKGPVRAPNELFEPHRRLHSCRRLLLPAKAASPTPADRHPTPLANTGGQQTIVAASAKRQRWSLFRMSAFPHRTRRRYTGIWHVKCAGLSDDVVRA